MVLSNLAEEQVNSGKTDKGALWEKVVETGEGERHWNKWTLGYACQLC